MLDVHCVVLSGKATWRLTRSTPGNSPEDVVCLRFSTASFGSLSERDAYERIRAVLQHENIAWVQPSPQEWLLDLNGLFSVIGRSTMVPWLKGKIDIEPEFKTEILSAASRKVGD